MKEISQVKLNVMSLNLFPLELRSITRRLSMTMLSILSGYVIISVGFMKWPLNRQI